MLKKFDLKQLLEHINYIGEKRWGQTLQFNVLEKAFIPIREGKEELSPKHIKIIEDDCAFTFWWKMPEINEVDFFPLKGIFSKLKPQDNKVIGMLFDLLKNIEIVSCVIRFIDPQNYGIMSPPVENLLNVRGRHQIEKYLNYLQNLEELREEYNFHRIADVDMALWVLANIVNYSDLRHHPIYSDFYEIYEQSTNPVKKIMARNCLEHVIEEQPLFKAELFLDSDFVTAGMIVGRELDLFVKALCEKNGIKLAEKTKQMPIKHLHIPELAEKLFMKRIIKIEDKEDIDRWWKYRCDLIHEERVSITHKEIKNMIEGIKLLKQRFKL